MIMQNHNIEDITLSKINSNPYWAKNKRSKLQQSACGLLAKLDLRCPHMQIREVWATILGSSPLILDVGLCFLCLYFRWEY